MNLLSICLNVSAAEDKMISLLGSYLCSGLEIIRKHAMTQHVPHYSFMGPASIS